MPRYEVTLPPGGAHTVDAASPEDAIAKYNEWSGVLSTDNTHGVVCLDAPEPAPEPKKQKTK